MVQAEELEQVRVPELVEEQERVDLTEPEPEQVLVWAQAEELEQVWVPELVEEPEQVRVLELEPV